MSEDCWSDGKAPTSAELRILAALAEERPVPKEHAAAFRHLEKVGVISWRVEDEQAGWELTPAGAGAATLLAQREEEFRL